MNRPAVMTIALSLASGCALLAQNPVIAGQKVAYTHSKTNPIKAAEKMPEAAYSFKPIGAATVRERFPDGQQHCHHSLSRWRRPVPIPR